MKKLFIFTLFLVIFAGCREENNLVNPISDKPEWEMAAEAQGLHFISLPSNADRSLKKVVLSTSEFITASTGGTLTINNHYRSEYGTIVKVTSELTVPANALDADAVLSMAFAEDNLNTFIDLTFAPASAEFNTPALLDLKASGLDLSQLSPDDNLKLVYYNEKKHRWEEMNAESIAFDIAKGEIVCVDGELPHFSRYGFTR